ncbi:cytochrome P450 [Kutzneria kofuensis]|uniref:Cytochrome P450 n=1 Tax=Kutzneria kofuensis TaxID=103725 RepID=A0A7W9NLH7_9PSEU|nr:cytochrome P450 [Kutzneria kofuensis]MBB5896784.1 cytochrome P450 [Kutzneria kofuensis]
MTDISVPATETGTRPGRLPVTRSCPYDPPEELLARHAVAPVSPLAFPDGRDGWLVTGFDEGRAALADPAIGVSGAHAASPVGPDRPYREPPPAPPGMFILMDPPEHTRYRRLLTGYFTTRRVRALKPRITEIIAERLDAMAAQGAAGDPVDLVRAFALPIPSLVICELLGVPYADLEEFQSKSESLLSLDGEENGAVEQARDDICGYIYQLVLAKRRAPADDLISALVAAAPDDAPLSDTELVSIATLLLIAGHETTASMLSLGALTLLRHPEQRSRLTTDTAAVVEELLRHLTVFHLGLSRVVNRDTTIGGQAVRAGDPVLVSLAAADRDAARFPDPAAFRTDREPTANLAFGHGAHACIGANLARAEIGLALTALFDQFPRLRLAVPESDLVFREQSVVYGVAELPVTW